MYAIDFFYDKEKLSDYKMMICNFDGSNMETVSSGADITFNQIATLGSFDYRIGSAIHEAYTTTFQICRNACGISSQDELYLTPIEVSSIQRWLCRDEYHEFKIDQDNYLDVYWNATFSSKQIVLNGKIIGLELTMVTDAPYAYMDEIEISFDCNVGETYHIFDYSDKTGFVYPDLEIEFLESSNAENPFKLENSLDDSILKIENVNVGEIIKIDGRNQIISLLEGTHPSLSKDFNYFFPKIINTYENNKNDYSVSHNCKITFRYSPIRMVGL